MPGWAKELAEKIMLQEKQREESFQRQQQRRKLYQENAPQLWIELADFLRMDLLEFNAAFQSDMKHSAQFERFPENPRVSPQRVKIKRAGYVTAQLETWLELEMEGIEYRISRRVSHEGVTTEKKGLLKIVMDEKEHMSMQHDGRPITPEAAAQLILRPVLTP